MLGWSHIPSAAISPQAVVEEVRQLWAAPVLFLGKPLEVFAQPGKAGLANTSQQDLPGGTCKYLCPRHHGLVSCSVLRPLVLP